jgi:signal transduction histidine kinase
MSSEILVKHSNSLEAKQVQEMGQNILNMSKRLHRVIQNFLLKTELEVVARDSLKLKELRNSYVKSSSGLITGVALEKAGQFSRQNDLKMDLVPEAPVIIKVEHLKKLVEELIDNAFNFSPAGTPVTLTTRLSPNKTKIILLVENYGRGMTAEQIKKIGIFSQFDRDKYEQQGLGVGLIIVKQLVEIYNGDLDITSIPGSQTLVRVTLPTGLNT